MSAKSNHYGVGKMKIAVETLGCRANQAESESLMIRFIELGFDLVEPDANPDVFVLNTCSVTTAAEATARKLVRRQKKNNSDLKVIFTGCYAKLAQEEILDSLPEIDYLFPGKRKQEIPDFIINSSDFSSGMGDAGINFRTRKFLKIQDGCRDFCSYCIVPYIRNELKSVPLRRVVEEVIRFVVEEKYSEIVFTGIHLGQYGVDFEGGEGGLVELVERIENTDFSREVRFRLSSLEPQDASEKLIEKISTASKFCNHLHLPLQSGSDHVLQRMSRSYNKQEYLDTIEKCRSYDSDFAISTDLIVGFPGETEADFKQTLDTVEEAEFSDLHVFRYSKRPGTRAATFKDEIPGDVAASRSKKLRSLGKKLTQKYARSFIGKQVRVLIENDNSEEYSRGYSSYYLPVKISGSYGKGTVVEAVIDDFSDGELFVSNTVRSKKWVT
jgi:threonylcarbamoyladenosine tRNA methylthiotransferase MtaB